MGVWDWSAPLGLGAFILAIGLTLLVLAAAIKTLATIPSQPNTSSSAAASRSTSSRRRTTRRR